MSRVITMTTILVMLARITMLIELVPAASVTVPDTETIIASKRTKDLVITITRADGPFTGGENRFCVTVQKRETQEPVEVQNFSIDFELLTGRTRGSPISGDLTADRVGHYCGRVYLRKQQTSSYYAYVRFRDSDGKKWNVRLFVSVR